MVPWIEWLEGQGCPRYQTLNFAERSTQWARLFARALAGTTTRFLLEGVLSPQGLQLGMEHTPQECPSMPSEEPAALEDGDEEEVTDEVEYHSDSVMFMNI